jgi:hypothetical protein
MTRLYEIFFFLQGELEKPREESTDPEDTDEIVTDTDDDEWERLLLEIPVSEILDKYESHIHLHDEECRDSCTRSVRCSEEPECHSGVCDDESHEELEDEHHGELWRCWHLVLARHREILDPDLTYGCDRIVPEPSEDKKEKRPTHEDPPVSERSEHKREEVHIQIDRK